MSMNSTGDGEAFEVPLLEPDDDASRGVQPGSPQQPSSPQLAQYAPQPQVTQQPQTPPQSLYAQPPLQVALPQVAPRFAPQGSPAQTAPPAAVPMAVAPSYSPFSYTQQAAAEAPPAQVARPDFNSRGHFAVGAGALGVLFSLVLIAFNLVYPWAMLIVCLLGAYAITSGRRGLSAVQRKLATNPGTAVVGIVLGVLCFAGPIFLIVRAVVGLSALAETAGAG